MTTKTAVPVLFLISASLSPGPLALAKEARQAPPVVKDWTFLTYLNGNNNLDHYGDVNIRQMETVGSTDKVDVVVQWASLERRKTVRLHVEKSSNPSQVTSPVVDDLGSVDMGDWRNLVKFVEWGVQAYPARHYFINVWNHGSGWHSMSLSRNSSRQPAGSLSGIFHPTDISWDEITGHSITTLELGQAMAESARIIGHKVDVYGSDACLMGMLEIGHEMKETVQVYAGSQELEPAAGWPYDALLRRWNAQPAATPQQVGAILSEEYVKSYQGGSNGRSEVTFSAYDLGKIRAVTESVSRLGDALAGQDGPARRKAVDAAIGSQFFFYSDYVDLSDFMDQLEKRGVTGAAAERLAAVREALNGFVVANNVTAKYSKAKGVSLWIPQYSSSYQQYESSYKGLKFDQDSHWAASLKAILATSTLSSSR